MKKISIYFLMCFFLLKLALADIVINEVMYNPEGTDGGHEWIEIYSYESVNLSGWKFYEAGTSHGLNLINGSWVIEGYAIIADEWDVFLADYLGYNGTLIDTSWSSLSNSGEYIALKNSSLDIVNWLNYSTELANGNGNTLEFYDGNWYESSVIGGTPGSRNSYAQNQTGVVESVHDGDTLKLANNEWVRLIGIDTPEDEEYYYNESTNKLKELVEGKTVILERDIDNRDIYNRLLRYIYVDDLFVNLILVQEGYAKAYPFEPNTKHEDEFEDAENEAKNSKAGIWSVSQDYTSLEITEFLPDPEGYDNDPMPKGEWIELYNPTNAAMDLKWMFFKDLFGHTLYITDTTVTDTTVIPRNGYLVVYTNGKSGFLNNEGQEALEFYDKSGEIIKNISYIDPVEGNSYAYVEGSGWQHTKPTPNEENVDNSTGKESSLEIEKIYDLGSDKTAKFGQTIRVKVHVYKGDTTKNSIALYVENRKDRISKQSKTSVYTRYTDYSLVIPIQLKPNCNEEFDDDDYYVYIKGLDKEDKEEIEVEGITDSLCQKVKTSSSSTRGSLSYEAVNLPNEIENNNEIVSELELSNDGDEDISLELWSYVYRGSKSYSGEREENKIEVEVPAYSERTVKLYNTVSGALPGDYKLKTKIKRVDQKTAKEITKDIKVVALKQAIKDNPGSRDINPFAKNRGIIYESSTIKAAKIVPYLIIILTTLLCIILIWKR